MLPAAVADAGVNPVTVPQAICSPMSLAVSDVKAPEESSRPVRQSTAPIAIGGGGLGSDPATAAKVVVPICIDPAAVAVGGVYAVTRPQG